MNSVRFWNFSTQLMIKKGVFNMKKNVQYYDIRIQRLKAHGEVMNVNLIKKLERKKRLLEK